MNRILPRIFIVERPASYWEVVGYHLPLALATGIVLLLAWLVPFHRISFRICTFYRVTGYPCPSCGFTRGFEGLMHGYWLRIALDCPLAIPIFLLTVIVFFWNTAALAGGIRLRRGSWLQFSGGRVIFLAVIGLGLLLANWFYRLSQGLN